MQLLWAGVRARREQGHETEGLAWLLGSTPDERQLLRDQQRKRRAPLLVGVCRIAVAGPDQGHAYGVLHRMVAAIRVLEAPGVHFLWRVVPSWMVRWQRYWQEYQLAEDQAQCLLRLLDITSPHVRYDRLLELPNITVKPEPKYRMRHAGMSRYHNGQWLILVDQNDVHGRRRYTLAHELKHVIDDPMEQMLYAELGYGDPNEQQRQIEALCQYFAACFLMPREWVTAAWLNGIRDVYNLASLFQVSASAMHVRLKYLGLWQDNAGREAKMFFREVQPGRQAQAKTHLPNRE